MRRLPLLGATGIDFGAKPAISFVLPRRKKPSLLDDDKLCTCGYAGGDEIEYLHYAADPEACSPCRSFGQINDIMVGDGELAEVGRFYLHRTQVLTGCADFTEAQTCEQCDGFEPPPGAGTITVEYTWDPNTCQLTIEPSGAILFGGVEKTFADLENEPALCVTQELTYDTPC